MKILVIGGGISGEREISLRSAGCVHKAAQAAGHDTEFYDWQGEWDWLDENLPRFEAVLPILHGRGGEDGLVQAYLEKKGATYLGADSKASELCFYKDKTNKFLRDNNILMPAGEIVDHQGYINSELSPKPHVLKPLDGGSSIDTLINIIRDEAHEDTLKKLFGKYDKMLIEEFVSGPELTAPILDGQELPIIEIVPPAGGVFDYDNKYNGTTQEICPPASVDESVQNQAKELGKKVHEVTGCRHLSRVDFILHDDKLYVLEINTMPGMTDASLFPLAASKIGLDMSALVDYLIKLAAKD
jgi:D-alanine-D-alanine ligase